MKNIINPGHYINIFPFDPTFNNRKCSENCKAIEVPEGVVPCVQFAIPENATDVWLIATPLDPSGVAIPIGSYSGIIGDVSVLLFCDSLGNQVVQVNEAQTSLFDFSEYYYAFWIIDEVGTVTQIYQTDVINNFCKIDCNLLKLEWRNDCDTTQAYYQNTGFSHCAWFDAEFTRPSFNSFINAKDNGFGGLTNLYSSSRIRESFDIIVAEWMLYGLTNIPFHNQVRLTNESTGEVCELENIQITDEGGPDDCFGVMNISYNIKGDELVTKSCCDNNNLLLPCT